MTAAISTLTGGSARFTATVDHTSVNGKGVAPSTVTTGSVTASPVLGSAPFSYSWTRTDGGSYPWTINNPSSATTTFSSTLDGGATFHTATFACTITDAVGDPPATTPPVSAQITEQPATGG